MKIRNFYYTYAFDNVQLVLDSLTYVLLNGE